MSLYLIGSELSPFSLKVEALLQHCGVPYIFLPNRQHRWRSLCAQVKVRATRAGLLRPQNTHYDTHDDLPLVPYLYQSKERLIYHSSYIAKQLETEHSIALIPQAALERFLHNLIEDFADEMGLYVVHHHRWVTSKNSNNAGARLADEWRSLLGPFAPLFGRWFARRQTRRLPYLFSVAANQAELPATHTLIENLSIEWLNIMEELIQKQPYLFHQFSAADAAIYGQWSMNLDDPCAANLMQNQAPSFHRWVKQIRHDNSAPTTNTSSLDNLRPLLALINRYFIPLMQQNFAAWQRYSLQGQALFNEAAFNRKQALYSGEINGHEFTSVAKSFQAKRWQQRLEEWGALGADNQRQAIELGLGALKLAPNHIRQ